MTNTRRALIAWAAMHPHWTKLSDEPEPLTEILIMLRPDARPSADRMHWTDPMSDQVYSWVDIEDLLCALVRALRREREGEAPIMPQPHN